MSELMGNCKKLVDRDNAESYLKPFELSVQTLKNNSWCCSKNTGMPGQVSNVKMSKTGKHGHAKFTYNLKFPFTGQTSQEMYPGHTHMTRPEIKKQEYLVCEYDKESGNLSVLDEKDEAQDFFLDPNFVDKAGKEKGQEFCDLYDLFEETGDEIYISVCIGPVKDKKKPFLVAQVEGWKMITNEQN